MTGCDVSELHGELCPHPCQLCSGYSLHAPTAEQKTKTKLNKFFTTEAHKQTHTSFPLPLPERYRTFCQDTANFLTLCFQNTQTYLHHTLHQTSGHLYKVISFKFVLQGMWNVEWFGEGKNEQHYLIPAQSVYVVVPQPGAEVSAG